MKVDRDERCKLKTRMELWEIERQELEEKINRKKKKKHPQSTCHLLRHDVYYRYSKEREEVEMRKKFTTYLEEEHIAWLKRRATELEIEGGKKVTAADVLNNLIKKEIKMKREAFTSAYMDKEDGDVRLGYSGMDKDDFEALTFGRFIEVIESKGSWDDVDAEVYRSVLEDAGLDYDSYDDPDKMWDDFLEAVEK